MIDNWGKLKMGLFYYYYLKLKTRGQKYEFGIGSFECTLITWNEIQFLCPFEPVWGKKSLINHG